MKKNKCKIKTFWFDLGNVVIPFDVNIAARGIFQYTDKSIKEIYEIFFDSPVVVQFSEGKITSEEFFEEVKNIFSMDNSITYAVFKKIWNDIFIKEDEKVCNLIRELKKRYEIVIVSNINEMHYDYIKREYKIMDDIEKKVLSFKVEADKPDLKIYNEAFRKTNANPEEIIYIDDREDLIKAVVKLGVKGIQYKGYKNLIKQLKEFGIDNYL